MEKINFLDFVHMADLFDINKELTIKLYVNKTDNNYRKLKNVKFVECFRNEDLPGTGIYLKFSQIGDIHASIASDMFNRIEYEKLRFMIDDKEIEFIGNVSYYDYDADIIENIYTSTITLEVNDNE